MKAQVKTKKLNDVINNLDGLSGLFNQMIGIDNANINITYNKYIALKKASMSIIDILTILSNLKELTRYDDIAPTLTHLNSVCAAMKIEHAKLFELDLSEYEWNLSLVPKVLSDKFGEQYRYIKTSTFIKPFMYICNNLWPYKKYFEDEDNLSYSFILNMSGVEWCPLVVTNLNIKYIMSAMSDNKDITSFFITFLNKLFVLCNNVYDIIHTPDIDIEMLGQQLIDNICSIEKIPELSRCSLVFTEIRKNIELFKKNFNSYYYGFVKSQNKMSILFDFITDIGKNKPNDMRLMIQIKQVLKFYRKLLNSQVKDSALSSILDQVDKTLDNINEGMTNVSEPPEVEVEDEPQIDEDANVVVSRSMTLDDIRAKNK